MIRIYETFGEHLELQVKHDQGHQAPTVGKLQADDFHKLGKGNFKIKLFCRCIEKIIILFL